MFIPSSPVALDSDEKVTLELWSRPGRRSNRLRLRARIILFCAEGKSVRLISSLLNTRPNTVSKWRGRFLKARLNGLADEPRPGRVQSQRYPADVQQRILKKIDEKPPEGYAQWNGSLLAKALDINPAKVWQVLRQQKVSLARKRSWCVSTDPEFAPKAADIVGLYLNPPENAVVLCMDEKPCIQALERAQGWLKLPDGRALTGFSHEYKRHGTLTLFAALEVATGLVKASQFKRRRRKEFEQFLDELVEIYGQRELHVILDNLSTHKLPMDEGWLARHPHVHFHFTPTHASWMNMVEVWFSLLSRRALRGASFTSVEQLGQAIRSFVEVHNQNSYPFNWTKAKVGPKGLKPSIAFQQK
jgi:transposase